MKLGNLKEHREKFKKQSVSEKSSTLSVEGFNASKVFEEIANRVKSNAALAKEIDGIYEFQLSNSNGKSQSWTVDLKKVSVFVGKADKPECTLKMSDENFIAIMTGDKDSTELFFSGELKIDGDMGLVKFLLKNKAMKLGTLKQEAPKSKL
jgi:putative sterol carrier protein